MSTGYLPGAHRPDCPVYAACGGGASAMGGWRAQLKTEAVVLRSIRYAEADRVLHLYTSERGRVNAIAKGVRKTGSRLGARLEPLTHAALLLHEGRGELHTVSGADIVRPHEALRGRPARLAVGLIGAEAVLKLFVEPEPNPRRSPACAASSTCSTAPERAPSRTLDALGLAFQLKLLTVAGYLPHLDSCASCGFARAAGRFSAGGRRRALRGLPGPAGGFRLQRRRRRPPSSA